MARQIMFLPAMSTFDDDLQQPRLSGRIPGIPPDHLESTVFFWGLSHFWLDVDISSTPLCLSLPPALSPTLCRINCIQTTWPQPVPASRSVQMSIACFMNTQAIRTVPDNVVLAFMIGPSSRRHFGTPCNSQYDYGTFPNLIHPAKKSMEYDAWNHFGSLLSFFFFFRPLTIKNALKRVSP